MKQALLVMVCLAGVIIGFQNIPLADVNRFTVPEGFVVEEVYSPEKAGSVVALTFDHEGRLVISREDSFIVTLFDTDGDGTLQERVFTDKIYNSQGLIFDGPDLLAVGNGPDSVALYRVVDEGGDSRGDRIEVVEKSIGRMSDHGPHQPFFGPDGYLYWTLGNMSHTYSSVAPLSPFRDYEENTLAPLRTDPRGHARDVRSPGGTFARKNLQETESDWEQVVGGFRNQYDGAFNMMGELFTFDSDQEWDRNLPWYRPTRTVHAVPGGDFGWRVGSGKHPDYYIDTLPPVEDMGRGSPTGVTFYQSYNYPSEYWDVFLQADWSRGRIVMGKLTKNGATYTQESETFVYGEPLNVTDVAVGPDGNVYFALGGRGTQGGIYRIIYTGSDRPTPPAEANTALEKVLTMPQPRSAWSRENARDVKGELGEAAWRQGLTMVVTDKESSSLRRVRAMELLHVFGPGLDEELLARLGEDASWEVRAASTYYLGIQSGNSPINARRELVKRLKDVDPFVQRRAAEALIRTGIHPAEEARLSAVGDVFPLLASDDRFVRYAGKELLRRINRNDWQEAALTLDEYPQAPMALLAYVQTVDAPSTKHITFLVERELELLKGNPSTDELLALLRTMQITMVNDLGLRFPGGGRFDRGPGAYPQMAQMLLDSFPTDHDGLDREIARTLAYLEPEEAVGALAAELHNPDNSREQRISYAYALSNIQIGWDEASRDRMITWFEKVRDERWKGGASFVGYLTYMLEDFAANQPREVQQIIRDRVPQLTLESGEMAVDEHGRRFRGPQYQAWLSDEEIEEDLIYNPGRGSSAAEGAVAYEKAYCASCHTFGPLGQEFGPDLTTVGQRFSRSDLVRAVLYPSETISDQWAMEDITMRSGETVSGTAYRENTREVVIQIPGGGQKTIAKSEILSRAESSHSPMPDGLLNNLDLQEMRGLFIFLEAGPEAIPDSLLFPR